MASSEKQKKKKIRHPIRILLILLFIILVIGWLIFENRSPAVTEYTVYAPEIPSAFDGYKIVQISDLHCAVFGDQNQTLLNLVRRENPDMIALTGDLTDGYHPDDEIVLSLARELVPMAPCYFVMGNHEAGYPGYKKLRNQLTEIGVVFLKNRVETIERGSDRLTLIGVDDPNNSKIDNEEIYMRTTLDGLSDDFSGYSILLSHRPEFFDIYVKKGINLVFSGHTHGGQIHLPFIGGIYVPNQGFFPKYDAGRFAEEGTTMIISRGLGESRFPVRIGNRPEVVAVTLRHRDG